MKLAQLHIVHQVKLLWLTFLKQPCGIEWAFPYKMCDLMDLILMKFRKGNILLPKLMVQVIFE